MESRRGGGGYIRITRVQVDRQTLLMHVINSVGDTLDSRSARAIAQNLVDGEAVSHELGQALLLATGPRAPYRLRRRSAATLSRRHFQADTHPFGLIFFTRRLRL